MRIRLWLIAALASTALSFAPAWTTGSAAPTRVPGLADNRPNAVPVDTELVIAVDVSYSMDPEEQELQREGYIVGLTSPEFMTALKEGAHGRIAITYFEWAALNDQTIIVPWRLIEGPESADAFVNELARAPYRRAPRTSIYGALQFAKPLFDASGYHGTRRVIDVSGDGPNNMGPSVTIMRDEVLAAGITINGLPIMLGRPGGGYGRYRVYENLDVYYEDCVIGGPGSFVIGIRDRSQFKEATRHKLVQEIASVAPKPRLMPAEARTPRTYCS